MGFALNHKIRCVWGFCLIAVMFVSIPALALEPLAQGEEMLFQRLNEERIDAGRIPVVHDPLLRELARKKAVDMAVNAYFNHVSPTLGTVYDMLGGEGISYKWAGENIARASSMGVIHDAFMDSPDHRANILSAGYTHVGVGAISYRGKVYVAQIFMKPRS